VNETLRWRPVAIGGVPHFTTNEDTYMGHRIPANCIVLANHYAITREESVFGEKADEFLPERWLTEVADQTSVGIRGQITVALKDLPQTGFGFGRRICTGKAIARNDLFIELARVLWAFDVKTVVVGSTGRRHQVDDMACTEGFVTVPKAFRAVFSPRGDWVRAVISAGGTTHSIKHSKILHQAGKEGIIVGQRT
jgi:cytochrome P450